MTAKAMKNTAELKVFFSSTLQNYMPGPTFRWNKKKNAMCRLHIIYIIVQIETCLECFIYWYNYKPHIFYLDVRYNIENVKRALNKRKRNDIKEVFLLLCEISHKIISIEKLVHEGTLFSFFFAFFAVYSLTKFF